MEMNSDQALRTFLPRRKSWMAPPPHRLRQLRSWFSPPSNWFSPPSPSKGSRYLSPGSPSSPASPASPRSTLSGDASTGESLASAPTFAARWWMLLPIMLPQFAGLALVLPTLPKLKLDFFHGDAAHAARVQSLMESSRAVFSVLVTVELGRLADTFGRRPLVLLSVACTLTPLVSLFFSSNLWYYFVLFTLAGALGGQATPATSAYVADCCPQQVRARSFGLLGAATSGLFMLMPASGAMLEGRFGQRALFLTAVCCEVVAMLFALLLPESLPIHKRKAFEYKAGPSAAIAPLRVLFSRRGSALWQLAVFRFLTGFAQCGTVTFFVLTQLVGFTDSDFGSFFALNGFIGLVSLMVVMRFLIWCGCGELNLMIFAQVSQTLQTAGYLLLAIYPRKELVFALVLVGSLSSLGDPSFQAFLTKGLNDDIGFLLGVFNAVNGLVSFLAPLVVAGVFMIAPLAPFALATVLNLIALFVVVRLRLASAEESAGADDSTKPSEERAEANGLQCDCTIMVENGGGGGEEVL